MKPASAKQKGRLAQQEICKSILAAFPELEPDDVVSTSMGAPGEDIRLSPKARTLLPFTIEAKNTERLNVHSALEQAKSHTKGKNYIPLLIFRRNRTKLHVALEWEHFLNLLKDRHHGTTDS